MSLSNLTLFYLDYDLPKVWKTWQDTCGGCCGNKLFSYTDCLNS